jgi:hypothetical protein
VNHLEQQIAEKQKEYNDLEKFGKLKKHWLKVIKAQVELIKHVLL